MAGLTDLPLRDDLRGKEPYGAPMDPVTYALNVNENTHPVPPEVRQVILSHISRALETINRYPDREFTALREALASYATRSHRQGTLDASMVWAANGSNEVIQQVLRIEVLIGTLKECSQK